MNSSPVNQPREGFVPPLGFNVFVEALEMGMDSLSQAIVALESAALPPEAPAVAEDTVKMLFLDSLDIHVYHLMNKNLSQTLFVPCDASAYPYPAFFLAIRSFLSVIPAIGRVVLVQEREFTPSKFALKVQIVVLVEPLV